MDIKMILEKHAAWLRSEEGGSRANLSEANISWADLTGANLTGADLTGANLTGANLTWANLTGANLTGANLTRADLTRADLKLADLTGAKNVYQFGPMPTSGRICHAIWGGEEWTIYAGCFKGNCDELEAKVLAGHKCPVYLAHIALLRAWKYETK
jgi:hypothetical protein